MKPAKSGVALREAQTNEEHAPVSPAE